MIGILVLILVVWLIFWVLGQVVIPEPFGTVLKVVVVVFVILYLLGALGIWTAIPAPRIR